MDTYGAPPSGQPEKPRTPRTPARAASEPANVPSEPASGPNGDETLGGSSPEAPPPALKGKSKFTGQRIAAGAIGAVVTVVFLVVQAVGLWQDRDKVSSSELVVGDCISKPKGWNDDGAQLPSDLVTKVTCEGEHWAQVYFLGPLPGDAFPGDPAVSQAADDMCFSQAAGANLDPAHLEEVYVDILMPSKDMWEGGEHSAICCASNQDRTVTESWVVGS
jgi:hypothetical protein